MWAWPPAFQRPEVCTRVSVCEWQRSSTLWLDVTGKVSSCHCRAAAVADMSVSKIVEQQAQSHPLPNVAQLVGDVTQFLDSIDLRSGFWQVPLSLYSHFCTSFTLPSGFQCMHQRTVSPCTLLSLLSLLLSLPTGMMTSKSWWQLL